MYISIIPSQITLSLVLQLSYGNEHKSSNPECSNINIGGLHPFKSSWTQRTSQTLFMSQPFTITYGSPRTSVVASTSKEILHE